MNHLYFGDSLDILEQLHAEYPKGFIDLIYIDPGDEKINQFIL